MISFLKKTTALVSICLLANTDLANAQVATIANPDLNDQIDLSSQGGPVSGTIEIPINKSKVLQFDTAIKHSLIANPDIADIIPMTDQSLYVLGKTKGTTSLTLFGGDNNLLGVFDLNVTHDLAVLKHKLYEIAPDENIQVRTNGDSIVLSGEASNSNVASFAGQLAEQHAPGKVLNTITTAKSQQVMLLVKIAEVDRSTSKALGLSYSTFFNNLTNVSVLNNVLDPNSFASGVLNTTSGKYNFSTNVVLDALETKGVLTTLAEPTLVAVSGETAHFLAGGEFPVPVASETSGGGDPTITIEFKEFGVKLAYTPTVIGDTINLVIEPEVSVLDPAGGIQLNNIVIPGLITRRVHTTVDLKNGQSFAIAGLLQDALENEVDQIPLLGSLPILGALARSSRYRKRETELIIIVTPYIIEPDEGGEYILPTDDYIRPREADIFLNGSVEGVGGQTNYNSTQSSQPKSQSMLIADDKTGI